MNIDDLPSLAFEQRAMLPEIPALYFVVGIDGIMYIGQTQNLRARWVQHHKAPLMRVGHFVIYWQELSHYDPDTTDAETDAIALFAPKWNNRAVLGEASKSIKILLDTWQTITRICAITGEARATVVTRLATDELARLRQQARDTALVEQIETIERKKK